LQVNGTDNAVHGVFRQRNTDEFESIRPTNSAGKANDRLYDIFMCYEYFSKVNGIANI